MSGVDDDDAVLEVGVASLQGGDLAPSGPGPGCGDDQQNTLFGYTITDNGDNTMTFTATSAGHTATATAPIPPAFTGASVRFQAGAYQQADSTTGSSGPDDGARVTFHDLTVT